MEIEIESIVDNPLLERKEVRFTIAYPGEGTPEKAKVTAELIAKLKQTDVNAKVEGVALKIMQDADNVNPDADRVKAEIDIEQKRLAEIRQKNEAELIRLNTQLNDLVRQRSEAASHVPAAALIAFERIATTYDGEGEDRDPRGEVPEIDRQTLDRLEARFSGEIEQVPPPKRSPARSSTSSREAVKRSSPSPRPSPSTD